MTAPLNIVFYCCFRFYRDFFAEPYAALKTSLRNQESFQDNTALSVYGNRFFKNHFNTQFFGRSFGKKSISYFFILPQLIGFYGLLV